MFAVVREEPATWMEVGGVSPKKPSFIAKFAPPLAVRLELEKVRLETEDEGVVMEE